MKKESSIPNKTTALAQNQQIIEGIGKYLAHAKTLAIAGKSYAPSDLKAALQAEVDAESTLVGSRAQYRQQVVATRAARSNGRATRKLIKAYVLLTYGAEDVQALEGFGIPVPKTPERTAEAKAKAAALGAATRKARKEAIASIDAPAPAVPATPALPAAASVTPKQ